MAIIVLMLPIMLLMLPYSIGSFQSESIFNPLLFEVIGYLAAAVFGFLALKKRIFLIFSLIGWALLVTGNYVDSKKAQEDNNQACLELRQDKNCLEKEGGTMDCRTGEHAGIYSRICTGLGK